MALRDAVRDGQTQAETAGLAARRRTAELGEQSVVGRPAVVGDFEDDVSALAAAGKKPLRIVTCLIPLER